MEKKVGDVTEHDAERRAAEVELIVTLCVGDRVRIKDSRTDYVQTIIRIRIDDQPVAVAWEGQTIWLDVEKRVHKGDGVFLVQLPKPKPKPKPKRKPKPKPKPKPKRKPKPKPKPKKPKRKPKKLKQKPKKPKPKPKKLKQKPKPRPHPPGRGRGIGG